MEELEIRIMQLLWEADGPVSSTAIRQSGCGMQRDINAALSSLLHEGHIQRTKPGRRVHYQALHSFSDYGLMLMEEHIRVFYRGDLNAFLAAFRDKSSSADNPE